MEKSLAANRWFARNAKHFYVAKLDTRNGRASFTKQLKVKRNEAYVLILDTQGVELARLTKPRSLDVIQAFIAKHRIR